MKHYALGIALLLVAMQPQAAVAQNAVSRAPLIEKITVGAASAVAQAVRGRKYLALLNQSSTATISCTIDGTTAVLNAAGTITLLPYAGYVFDNTGFVPNTAITCIASAADTPLTLIE